MAKRKQNNTVIWVLLGILLACFLLLGYGFYKYFYAGSGDNKYGDRLDDIDKHKLNSTLESDVSKLFESNENVNTVKLNVEGKIIYITIDFKKALKTTDAQALAIKALEPIGEENLTYYDVQFLLTYTSEVSEENSNFPIFGSKNSDNAKVVW